MRNQANYSDTIALPMADSKTALALSHLQSLLHVWRMRVTFTDVAGAKREVEVATEGQSLMELAKANDIAGIMADCGGACSCATCHVYVDADWYDQVGAPDEIEFGMLDMVADTMQPNSRLACQIKLSDALDGLKVTVAPGGGF
jgi:ferredoxin, 2Fe-2S